MACFVLMLWCNEWSNWKLKLQYNANIQKQIIIPLIFTFIFLYFIVILTVNECRKLLQNWGNLTKWKNNAHVNKFKNVYPKIYLKCHSGGGYIKNGNFSLTFLLLKKI